jgi:hypothetical protein
LRNLHIEHRSNQDFFTVGQLQLAHRHVAEQQFIFAWREVREAD